MALTTVQAGILATPAQYTAMKNRLINGNMVLDQRAEGASVTTPTTGAFTYATCDRWAYFNAQANKYTLQQNSGAVTPPTGFVKYLGAVSTSAYTVLTGDYFTLSQAIEGFNTADLQWGTANAKTVTLSFWVRSSLTGTFGGSITNSANNRSYPFTYTITSANTWEYETITIAGDTSGTWLTTNGKGMIVIFGLGVGSTYSGTAGSWTANQYFSATGATSVVGTNGATFYLTGVQIEVGSSATGFEYRQYGQELALCQRYFSKAPDTRYTMFPAPNATFGYQDIVQFPVQMRANPTWTPNVSYSFAVSSFTVVSAGPLYASYQIIASSGTNISTYYTWTAAAEL